MGTLRSGEYAVLVQVLAGGRAGQAAAHLSHAGPPPGHAGNGRNIAIQATHSRLNPAALAYGQTTLTSVHYGLITVRWD